MEERRLKDKGPAGELMEVKVDVPTGDPNSTHSDARPPRHDRDPKGVNKSLKVTNVQCHRDLINTEHTQPFFFLFTDKTQRRPQAEEFNLCAEEKQRT